jgi:hypothetical protein
VGVVGIGPTAGRFLGNVEVTADIKIEGKIVGPGGDIEIRIDQLGQQVTQLLQQVNELLDRLNAQVPRTLSPGLPRLNAPFGIADGFAITGDSFSPNQLVTLRVADRGSFHNDSLATANADPNGHVEFRFALPAGFSIGDLFFAASDGRPNRHDLTGKLWAQFPNL